MGLRKFVPWRLLIVNSGLFIAPFTCQDLKCWLLSLVDPQYGGRRCYTTKFRNGGWFVGRSIAARWPMGSVVLPRNSRRVCPEGLRITFGGSVFCSSFLRVCFAPWVPRAYLFPPPGCSPTFRRIPHLRLWLWDSQRCSCALASALLRAESHQKGSQLAVPRRLLRALPSSPCICQSF